MTHYIPVKHRSESILSHPSSVTLAVKYFCWVFALCRRLRLILWWWCVSLPAPAHINICSIVTTDNADTKHDTGDTEQVPSKDESWSVIVGWSNTSFSVRVMRAFKPSLDYVSSSQDVLVTYTFNIVICWFCWEQLGTKKWKLSEVWEEGGHPALFI